MRARQQPAESNLFGGGGKARQRVLLTTVIVWTGR